MAVTLYWHNVQDDQFDLREQQSRKGVSKMEQSLTRHSAQSAAMDVPVPVSASRNHDATRCESFDYPTTVTD